MCRQNASEVSLPCDLTSGVYKGQPYSLIVPAPHYTHSLIYFPLVASLPNWCPLLQVSSRPFRSHAVNSQRAWPNRPCFFHTAHIGDKFCSIRKCLGLSSFMSFGTLYSLPSRFCLLQYAELHYILLPSIRGLSLPKLQISMLYTMPGEETGTLTREDVMKNMVRIAIFYIFAEYS